MRKVCAAAAMAAAMAGATPAAAATFDLEYNASILAVVEMGKISLKGNIGPTAYNAAATVETSGVAKLFDDTRIRAAATGAASATGLSWASYTLSHDYAKKHRMVAMTRTAAGVGARIVPAYGNLGEPPASAAQKTGARDPVTTMAELGRAVAVSGKCAGTFPTFDGKQYYTLTLTPKTRAKYQGGGYNGDALVCNAKYTPLAGFKMTAADKAKIPLAEIWFATAKNGFAAPLRIEVPTPLGPARLDLARGLGL